IDPRRAGLQLCPAQQASRVGRLSLAGDPLRAGAQPGDPLTRSSNTLTELARLGFAELGAAERLLAGLPDTVVPLFSVAADPDQALPLLPARREQAPREADKAIADPGSAERVIRVLGASDGLGGFLLRHP